MDCLRCFLSKILTVPFGLGSPFLSKGFFQNLFVICGVLVSFFASLFLSLWSGLVCFLVFFRALPFGLVFSIVAFVSHIFFILGDLVLWSISYFPSYH